MDDLLKSAKSGTARAGRNELIKHLEGIRLTRQQAIKAKCYDCNGMGEEKTCEIKACSLYPYSLYSPKGRKSPRALVESLCGEKKGTLKTDANLLKVGSKDY